MLKGLATHIESLGLKFADLIYDEQMARNILTGFKWTGSRGVRTGFTHRFVKIDNVVLLLRVFRKVAEDYGSIGSFVKNAYSEVAQSDEPVEKVLRSLVSFICKYGGKPPLVPKGVSSPLKRLNLFMRWMVRPYPDLNLWRFIDKKESVSVT